MATRPKRALKAWSRFGQDEADEDAIIDVLQAMGATSQEDDPHDADYNSSDDEAAPAPKRKQRLPPSGARPAELAALLSRCLGVPALALALARVDVPTENGGLVVRTPALAALDVASLAVALGMRADAMGPLWRALAEECVGGGLPANQHAAMYQACVQVAAATSRQFPAPPMTRREFENMYHLGYMDTKDMRRVRGIHYALADIQRAAHAKFGDAAALVAAKMEHAARVERERVEREERERAAKQARTIEVVASLEEAGLDVSLMDQPPFRNFVLYGENYYNFSLSAMVDQALAAAVARRTTSLARRLEQDGLPAEWAQSEMLEGYRARGEISLSAALARAHRRQELSQQLAAVGLEFDYAARLCRQFVHGGGAVAGTVAAMQELQNVS